MLWMKRRDFSKIKLNCSDSWLSHFSLPQGKSHGNELQLLLCEIFHEMCRIERKWMGSLMIQIASLSTLFLSLSLLPDRAHEKEKNVFNINAPIYKGFNKWMKIYMYMREDCTRKACMGSYSFTILWNAKVDKDLCHTARHFALYFGGS